MTRVKASDLPVATRRKLGLEDEAKASTRPSRAGVGHAAACPGRCGCGETFPTYSKWEKHAAATNHHRWSIDL